MLWELASGRVKFCEILSQCEIWHVCKQQHADSLLYSTTSHTQHLYHFKILGTAVPENFPMYYIGVRDGKRRQTLITASWFSIPQYTWPLTRYIQN